MLCAPSGREINSIRSLRGDGGAFLRGFEKKVEVHLMESLGEGNKGVAAWTCYRDYSRAPLGPTKAWKIKLYLQPHD